MIQAIQLILALSFLVLIHELGHFTFAKIFHVRVEKFYMFFNPWISLVRCKYFEGKWHVKFFAKNEDEEWSKYPDNTEWGIGWLPFGGYCAIAGMVDETHSTEDLAAEPQEWEFRSKPAWQRLYHPGRYPCQFYRCISHFCYASLDLGTGYLTATQCHLRALLLADHGR